MLNAARTTLIDRRRAMLGLAGLAVGAPAWADDESPIAHGVLAHNALALAFRAARRDLPDVTLFGPDGERDIESLFGRTILMPLWAEWCPACLSEMPDFSRLQRTYGNDKFAILPVLTGTRKMLTAETIAHIFKILHADALAPLIEGEHGSRLLTTMARKDAGYAIPCNLLIAPDGTVVAREIGRETPDDARAGPPPEKTPDPETVTRAIHGQAQSLWGKQEGEEFAAAMAAGFLG